MQRNTQNNVRMVIKYLEMNKMSALWRVAVLSNKKNHQPSTDKYKVGSNYRRQEYLTPYNCVQTIGIKNVYL